MNSIEKFSAIAIEEIYKKKEFMFVQMSISIVV